MAKHQGIFGLFTNAQPNKTVSVKMKKKNSTQISIPCPQLVVLYNKHMVGVNHNNWL